MPAVQFITNIPQYSEDLNNGQVHLVGNMIVGAIAYTGTVTTVDVISITWKGTDVTKYVYECQPETWDRIKETAKANYLTPDNVTS